jgi:hypothetical protein
LEKVYLTSIALPTSSNYQLGADQFILTIVLGPKTIEEKRTDQSDNYTMTIPVALHKGLIRSSLPTQWPIWSMSSRFGLRNWMRCRFINRPQGPLVARVRGNPQEGYVAGRPELLSLKEIELTGAPDALEQWNPSPWKPLTSRA